MMCHVGPTEAATNDPWKRIEVRVAILMRYIMILHSYHLPFNPMIFKISQFSSSPHNSAIKPNDIFSSKSCSFQMFPAFSSHHILVGGGITILKNMKVNGIQWEGLSHIIWKITNVWNHQPEDLEQELITYFQWDFTKFHLWSFLTPKPEIRAEGPKDGQERVSEHIQILGARRMVARSQFSVEIYGWIWDNLWEIYGNNMEFSQLTTWRYMGCHGNFQLDMGSKGWMLSKYGHKSHRMMCETMECSKKHMTQSTRSL